MTDQQPTAVQAQVRAQFDRQVAHYTQGSAMADQGLLELIVRRRVPPRGGVAEMWHAGQDSSHAPSPKAPGGSMGSTSAAAWCVRPTAGADARPSQHRLLSGGCRGAALPP